MLVLLLVTTLVLRARQQRYLAVGWFWFLGSLVPMIGLVQVGSQAMADRYAYVPFVGLFLMLTWLVADWAKLTDFPPRWIAISAVSCLLVLGALTYRQVGYWHDIQSFWQRTLALTQNNYVAHDTPGILSGQPGPDRRGGGAFPRRARHPSDDLPANLNLGTYEHGRGHLTSGHRTVSVGSSLHGRRGSSRGAYGNLGSAYRQMGESTKAKQYFETALQLAPEQTMAMIGLGLIAQKEGDLPEAIRPVFPRHGYQPTDVGYLLLAQALRLQGRSEEAKAISDRIARFSPNLPAAQETAESLLSGK